MSKLFSHEQPADNAELFYKQTQESTTIYEAVPFSLKALKDPHLLVRTTSNYDNTFCRYYPVRLLPLNGEQNIEVPYYAQRSLTVLLTKISAAKRKSCWQRVKRVLLRM